MISILFARRLFAYRPFRCPISGKTPSPLWDRLVFNKIQARLGGRVRAMASGASPLSPDILDFLRMYVDTSFPLHFDRIKLV